MSVVQLLEKENKNLKEKKKKRFMAASLSELVDNISGNVNSVECKSCT